MDVSIRPMKKFANAIRVVTVNLIVLIVLLGGIEFYFRHWVHERSDNLPNGLWQSFQPYVMITTAPGDYLKFVNTFTNETYPSTVRTNSLGYNDPHEFIVGHSYKKAANEKVVLFTGGSTAWGVGATATDRTVAGRMQYYLNTLQSGERYTVINLAMGSWIAFQEFIGLQQWGSQFDPDWVVSMDGFNDAGVGCAYSQGPGNPMYFATMRSYINGYLMSTLHPVFYRGWFENELILHSKAYRIITGKQYVADNQMFDQSSQEDSLVRRQIIPAKLGDARQMLAFYIASERGMLNLFPRAGYILSTQPVVNQFTGDFVDIYQHPIGSPERKAAIENRTKDLEVYLTQNENKACGQGTAQPANTYVFGNGAVQLEQLADEEAASGRLVAYYNIGTLFPDPRPERIPFFIDPPHLTDNGMDVIGKFYAEKILAADRERPAAAIVVAPAASTVPSASTAPAGAASAAPVNTEQREWEYLVGLTVKDETAVEPVVAGFQPRRLTATPTASRHGLGVRFDNLKPGGTYHLTVWLKAAPNAWAMVEGRDSNDPATGRPPHYGVASYDLAQAAMTASSGDLANPSVASAMNGWVKATFDLKTKDGRIFVTANLLEGSNGLMNFQGAGQSVAFGGIEIEERK
jgi:hypothetical protein